MMRRLALLAVVLVLMAAPAFADPLEKGDKELNFSFSFNKTSNGGDIDTLNFGAAFGYMLTDGHEVGGVLAYSSLSADDADLDEDTSTIGVFYHYNFRAGESMNPYFGAQVGIPGGDLSDYINLTYGLVGGLKFYPWEHGGFNFGLSWETWQAEMGDDLTNLALFAGVLIKF